MIEIVKPSYQVLEPNWPECMKDKLALIERAGRECWRSEPRGNPEGFIRNIVKRSHESVIEHAGITVLIICDRSCSHQLVRYRLAAYSQQSQRYVDPTTGPYQCICPPSIAELEPGVYERYEDVNRLLWFGPHKSETLEEESPGWHFLENRYEDMENYKYWLSKDIPKEDARCELPNATVTTVVTTFNMRVWRHVFKERAINKHAQWQIRGIFSSILDEFKKVAPCLFGDL